MTDAAPTASIARPRRSGHRRPRAKAAGASSRAPRFRSWWSARSGRSSRNLGIFPRKLFPPLEEVAATFVRLTADGILPHHVLDTLLRLGAGFALAAVAGVAIGIAMGRSRRAEDIFLPLVSIGAPIPGLAYAPLFLLWFGLGNEHHGAAGRLRLRLPHHLQHLDRGEGGQGNLGALGAGHGRR